MKKSWFVALALLASVGSANAATNVALGAAVTNAGPGFAAWSSQWGSDSFASLATVTDGVFVGNGQQWNLGTVFWNGASGGDASNTVTIALQQDALLNSITLQADNNDLYGVSYRDTSNVWHNLATIDPNTAGWGMASGSATLGAPVVATAFQIKATGGDGYYSVAEFQAFGSVSAVPEPETYDMLLAGIGLIAGVARRRLTN